MFRIIHPNRWFFWAIAVSLGTGLFLIWNIQESNNEFYAQTSVLETNVWRTWRSEILGISVRYPAGWQVDIDREDTHNVYLENSQNFHENISIAIRAQSLEATIRQSLGSSSETGIVIDGEPGRWLKGDDKGDQATSNVILVRHNSQLYYIAGSARVFNKIVKSMKFTDNSPPSERKGEGGGGK